MGASFTWDGKTIKNEEIGDVFLIIDLEEMSEEELEQIEDKYDYIEDYVEEKLTQETNLEVIDDELYFEETDDNLFFISLSKITGKGGDGYYPKNEEELNVIVNAYKEIYKAFGDYVKISVSCNLYKDGNTEDFTLEDFLERFKIIH